MLGCWLIVLSETLTQLPRSIFDFGDFGEFRLRKFFIFNDGILEIGKK